MKTIFVLASILCLSIQVIGQNGLTTINLPSSYTAAEMRYRSGIASDASNNLWVAFQYKGLAKYDGSTWTLYNSSNSQIPTDTILSLCIYNNLVYVGTPHGLVCFNGSSWTTWSSSDGLAGSQINGIFADGQSVIVTSEQHLSIKIGNTWTNHLIPNSSYNGSIYDYFNFHTPIIKDASGNIWIGRSDAGLLRFNGTTWESVLYHTNTTTIVRPRSMICDPNNNIWIGTSSTTLIFNGDSLITANQLYDDWMGVLPIQIGSFAANTNGEIFFGSNNYQYLLNEELQTIQLPIVGGYGLLSCCHNGSYKIIHAVSDATTLFSFNSSEYNGYGNVYTSGTFKYLDINRVKAGYGNRGAFFWDLFGSPEYEVPKGSGKQSSFCSGLWFGGLDANDNLHFSGVKFQQNGNDFFPGPLKVNGTASTDTAACNPFNKIWKINKTEIDNFRQWYADGSLGTGTHTIPEVIANWPAHGDYLNDYDYYMAPFVDTDSNGIYEPVNGDYPKIRGNQMLWWVYNDNLAPHGEFGGQALGVEVRVSAYAYGCDTLSDSTNVINYTTFLHYELINRSTYTYNNSYVGYFSETDLGDPQDDFVGSNVGLNSFYTYNGDESDGDGNGKTYGLNPPCLSIVVLNGAWAPESDNIDNDHDGEIDEMWESTGMSSFTFYNNSSGVTGDPITATEGYNYMNAKWKDGSPLQYGETGYNTGGVNCKYMFPGEPTTDPYGWGTGGIPQEDWSEETENNTPADRRGIASMGPFLWTPGGIQNIDLAFVWSRADSGGVYASVLKNQEETANIISWYNSGSTMPWATGGNFPYCDPLPNAVYENVQTSSSMELYPNPASDKVTVNSHRLNENYSIELINFSGQKIAQYQGKGQTNLDISGFPKGIYIVRLIGRQQIESRKLIIQ